MSALTEDRNTPQSTGEARTGDVAANVKIHMGALLMRDASGNILPAKTATGLMGAGRAEARVDNATGVAAAKTVRYLPGTFAYANSAGADAITKADIGKVCFAVDDQTVAKTNGSNTRSPAGIVDRVDGRGVWVTLNEALTRAA